MESRKVSFITREARKVLLHFLHWKTKQSREPFSHSPIFCALQIFLSAFHSNVCRHGGNCQRKSADCEIQPAAEAVDCETEITSCMQSACKLQHSSLLFSLHLRRQLQRAHCGFYPRIHTLAPDVYIFSYLLVCVANGYGAYWRHIKRTGI